MAAAEKIDMEGKDKGEKGTDDKENTGEKEEDLELEEDEEEDEEGKKEGKQEGIEEGKEEEENLEDLDEEEIRKRLMRLQPCYPRRIWGQADRQQMLLHSVKLLDAQSTFRK